MENTPIVDEVVVTKKNVLFEVTSVSKVLAGVLFIILPFIGGWIGYTYGSNNSTTEVTITVAPNTQNQITTPELDNEVNTVTATQSELKDILFNGQKTGYTTDGAVVFYTPLEGGPAVPIIGTDANTFEVLNADPTGYKTKYARDKNFVYSEDKRLVNVDPNAAELIGYRDSYLVTNIGLFSGAELVSETSKEYLNVYLVEQLEAANPYYIFVHDTDVDKWFSYIENELQPIDKPLSTELGMLIYPSPAQ